MNSSVPSAILLVGLLCACRPAGNTQFNKQDWNTGRQSHPNFNASPRMLADLMANHLPSGISLMDVTNLLGSPEIRIPQGNAVHIYGEFLKQTVYVYRPGMHNGWLLEGTNSLSLYFGHDGSYLKEWSPQQPPLKPLNVPESEATRNTLSNGELHIGNQRFASTTEQFNQLLGPPDEKRAEFQLDYYLGRRTALSMDSTYLELHFNQEQRLTGATSLEH
jgi:hypothetical protein